MRSSAAGRPQLAATQEANHSNTEQKQTAAAIATWEESPMIRPALSRCVLRYCDTYLVAVVPNPRLARALSVIAVL
jgi:hypothetical protein